MAEIVLEAIEKSFGETSVLKGVGLTIKPGDFVTLVGPSGCGKSTLLRVLAGLEAPDSGRVSIGGRDVTPVRPADRDLAMVFQSYALYPHLTVAENMLTPLRLRDLSAVERLPILGPLLARARHQGLRDQVRQTAQVLQIKPLLDRKPGQLSGGQRQRAALGRAMVRDPVAFLMDEPLSNLDAALRVHMRAELSELHRRLGKTFVYVTHDQAEALTMSSRMAVMMSGEILQMDTPGRIYEAPADLRVARFVGSPQINTLPAEADSAGRITVLGMALERHVDPHHAGPLTIGARPEHLALVPEGTARAIAGRLIYKENLGADTYLHLATHDGAHRLLVRAETRDAAKLSLQQTVHAGLARGEALVFGADEQRLTVRDAGKAQVEARAEVA
ncbi:MAG: ABC transporter ATP-binding protein [Pseudomonadota bacterium]